MPLKILIVEDEVLIAEMIKLHLESVGHQVPGLCISYEEAVAVYRQQVPDLAILDIRLYGDKSGIDFARFLSGQQEQIPFIYLTSQYDRRIFDKALDTTPYGYLTKPVRKETLLATIEVAYNKYLKDKLLTGTLTINDGKQQRRIVETDILYIKAEHVYSYLYLKSGETIITRTPIRQLEEEVNPKVFCRCHRSYIVNTLHIASWDKEYVTLSNGDVLPVSRARRDKLFGLI